MVIMYKLSMYVFNIFQELPYIGIYIHIYCSETFILKLILLDVLKIGVRDSLQFCE